MSGVYRVYLLRCQTEEIELPREFGTYKEAYQRAKLYGAKRLPKSQRAINSLARNNRFIDPSKLYFACKDKRFRVVIEKSPSPE